jgi:hypothetical protein
VALDAFNGDVADQEFISEYIRARQVRNTNPSLYDDRRVQGVRITPNRFETVMATAVANDRGPRPSVLRATGGQGVAQGTHWYVDEVNPATSDSVAGMTMANLTRASVYYAIDIRHWGRFAPEADRSGVQRVLLGGIDFLDQYGSVLPVEVVDFTATQTGREAVTVQWRTASEEDVAGLSVERSEVLGTNDGETLSGWQEIATVTPAGGPSTEADYDVLDQTVRMGHEYVYRLVSVEKDGSRTPAAEARVLVTGGTQGAYALEVSPNPVPATGATIGWRVPRGATVELNVIDAEGVVVKTTTATSEGTGSWHLDVSDLPSGAYVIELRSSGERLVKKVTIQQ